MKQPKHFVRSEFEDYAGKSWWEYLSPKLIGMLDQLREQSGKSIIIKKTVGAIGRQNGPGDKSSHNVEGNDFEELRAIDISVFNPDGSRLSGAEARVFITQATNIGFTGIGIYPYWSSPGFHLDVRWDKPVGKPATWADIGTYPKHDYTGMAKGLVEWDRI